MQLMILKPKPNSHTLIPKSRPKNSSSSMCLHAIHIASFDPLQTSSFCCFHQII